MYKSADITSWYQSLDPTLRDAAVRGLIGSALGAGTLGGVSAATSTGEHNTKRVVGNALMGALLGGAGAAGVPLGLSMITGKTKLPGEKGKPIVSRGIDLLAQPFTSNPVTTAGLGVGGYMAATGYPHIRQAAQEVLGKHPNPKFVDKLRAVLHVARNPSTLESGPEIARMLKNEATTVAGRGLARTAARGLYALPVGLGAGWLLDRYLKGKY